MAIGASRGRGRGVFARRVFAACEEIERAPVVVVPERDALWGTILVSYAFSWGDDGRQCAITLGYGSLYNHSYRPNARFIRRARERVFEIRALRPIRRDEEITINYRGDPADRGRVDLLADARHARRVAESDR